MYTEDWCRLLIRQLAAAAFPKPIDHVLIQFYSTCLWLFLCLHRGLEVRGGLVLRVVVCGVVLVVSCVVLFLCICV